MICQRWYLIFWNRMKEHPEKEMQEIHVREKFLSSTGFLPKESMRQRTIPPYRKEVSLPGTLKPDPPILIIILSLSVIQPGKFHLLREGDREGKGLNLIFCFRNNNGKFFPA